MKKDLNLYAIIKLCDDLKRYIIENHSEIASSISVLLNELIINNYITSEDINFIKEYGLTIKSNEELLNKLFELLEDVKKNLED